MNSDFTLKHRLDTAFFQIIDLEPGQRKDLQHMWRYARQVWNKLDIEMITCRRTNKLSPLYKDLEADLRTRLETIEQYLTFATLLTK